MGRQGSQGPPRNPALLCRESARPGTPAPARPSLRPACALRRASCARVAQSGSPCPRVRSLHTAAPERPASPSSGLRRRPPSTPCSVWSRAVGGVFCTFQAREQVEGLGRTLRSRSHHPLFSAVWALPERRAEHEGLVPGRGPRQPLALPPARTPSHTRAGTRTLAREHRATRALSRTHTGTHPPRARRHSQAGTRARGGGPLLPGFGCARLGCSRAPPGRERSPVGRHPVLSASEDFMELGSLSRRGSVLSEGIR